MAKKGKKSKSSKKQAKNKYTKDTDPILLADAKLMPKQIDDDILFQPHPPQPDCPICAIPLPLQPMHRQYQSCCGASICLGCILEVSRAAGDRADDVKSCCPFCRTPPPKTKKDVIKRGEKRVALGDMAGMFAMAYKYDYGILGLKKDKKRGVELLYKVLELGEGDDADKLALKGAYNNLGLAYLNGEVMRRDEGKARYCYELSASMGDAGSRHFIGCMDGVQKGDIQGAMRHFVLGAMAGHLQCLREVQVGFNLGFVTKEESEKALQAFHMSYDSMRSDGRDKALNSLAFATAIKHPAAMEAGYDKIEFHSDDDDEPVLMIRFGTIPEKACANCYKGGEGLKKCGACKTVQYCSTECQKVHRPKHKFDCQKHLSDMFDEKLFKEPEKQSCPLCLLRFPKDVYEQPTSYQLCCGVTLCMGCVVSAGRRCPSCFEPACAGQEEIVDLLKERMKCDDGEAFYDLGASYFNGLKGLPKDLDIAIDLMTRGAELGCADSQHMLGDTYMTGNGVAKDPKKAEQFYQRAAMQGHMLARHELGTLERERGNMERAKQHYMIAARAGLGVSMGHLRVGRDSGNSVITGKPYVTKEEYDETRRIHEAVRNEMRSFAREKAQLFFGKHCNK